MTQRPITTTRTIARALGAALLVAACAAPGPAGAQTAWKQVCIDAWDDAPAEL